MSMEGNPLTPEYFERWLRSIEALMDERDRRYEDKFRALDSATEKALSSVEKQTAAAFLANKESVFKTEEAQKAYNLQHNDLTRKMENQAAKFIDRERLEEFDKRFDAKLDALKSDIARLQEGSAAGSERRVTQSEHRATIQWGLGTAITVALVIAGLIVGIIEALLKAKP